MYVQTSTRRSIDVLLASAPIITKSQIHCINHKHSRGVVRSSETQVELQDAASAGSHERETQPVVAGCFREHFNTHQPVEDNAPLTGWFDCPKLPCADVTLMGAPTPSILTVTLWTQKWPFTAHPTVPCGPAVKKRNTRPVTFSGRRRARRRRLQSPATTGTVTIAPMSVAGPAGQVEPDVEKKLNGCGPRHEEKSFCCNAKAARSSANSFIKATPSTISSRPGGERSAKLPSSSSPRNACGPFGC